MGTFSADLAAYAKRVNRTLDQTHRAIVIELFSSVIMDTPVDQGTLRANWNPSSESPNFNVNESAKDTAQDRQSSSTCQNVERFNIKTGGTTYLANAMPYAVVAEYGLWGTAHAGDPDSLVTGQGYSKKAPAGMVRRNASRIRRIVKTEAAKARSRK